MTFASDGAPETGASETRARVDAELVQEIAAATRAALLDLRDRHPEHLYAVALLTSGEALAPYLSVCSVEADRRHGLERWSLADTPYAIWGYEEHFGEVARAFEARGHLFDDYEGDAADVEYTTRLVSMEEALRQLDVEGLFGTDETREGVLLLVGTMPPDPQDTAFVRRLNPAGPLFDEWLELCSEQPALSRDPVAAAEPAGHAGELAPPPTPALAELWRTTPGAYLPSGVAIYGPQSIAERNETFEVAEYLPGWVLVGDDGGGRGLLMRATGAVAPVAAGLSAAEVFLLDLGALGGDVEADGELLTDDLVGWVAARTASA